MKVYGRRQHQECRARRSQRIRKTQLASAILSVAGMVNRFGKVDEGTTVTDFDEEEIARKHTLSASLAYAEWSKQKINLIGHARHGQLSRRRARGTERRRRGHSWSWTRWAA